MNKLKTFFYVFKKSISSPEYYKELMETKFVFTVKYYLMLSFLASLLFASFVSIKMIPETREGLRVGTEEIKKAYPDDLVVNIKDGSWSINKPEPYIIPLPEFSKTEENIGIDNIIVFYKQGTIDDFNNSKTFALVNESNILTREGSSGIKVYPIKDFPNVDVDKTKVVEGVDKVYGYVKYVPFFLPLILLVGEMLFNYLGSKLIYILWISLAVYLLSLLKKSKVNFKSACRVGVHTMTIPIILETLIGLFVPGVSTYPWYFILNILLSFIVLDKVFKKKETLNPKI
ncbi:MAG: DUF1189 family protein [Patescibacteria group bacterium]